MPRKQKNAVTDSKKATHEMQRSSMDTHHFTPLRPGKLKQQELESMLAESNKGKGLLKGRDAFVSSSQSHFPPPANWRKNPPAPQIIGHPRDMKKKELSSNLMGQDLAVRTSRPFPGKRALEGTASAQGFQRLNGLNVPASGALGPKRPTFTQAVAKNQTAHKSNGMNERIYAGSPLAANKTKKAK